MEDESVGSARNDALNVREERLRRKLHRELGAVVLEALGDEKTIEVMGTRTAASGGTAGGRGRQGRGVGLSPANA